MYKVDIISEVHGTVPLVIPLCLEKNPPLFLIPSDLLGIPPLRVVRFLSTPVPGCLCTDLPPPFLTSHPPFPFPQQFLILTTCPPTMTSRRQLHMVQYTTVGMFADKF
jgi:hypothetical protein